MTYTLLLYFTTCLIENLNLKKKLEKHCKGKTVQSFGLDYLFGLHSSGFNFHNNVELVDSPHNNNLSRQDIQKIHISRVYICEEV